MEKMYQDYKDIAEFRLVYIREAHAMDSRRPVGYAKEKGISEHKDYEERCTTAKMLMDDESLTMPMLIDGMDNAANEAYQAYPDRVFLVRKDGRLAVAADRGPWGFGPGLKAAEKWLEDFAETDEDPELSEKQIAKADKLTQARAEKAAAKLASAIEAITGSWTVNNTSDGGEFTGQVKFAVEDGKAIGSASADGDSMDLSNLRFNGRQLSFQLNMHETEMSFVGTFSDGVIEGKLIAGDQEFKSQWKKDE